MNYFRQTTFLFALLFSSHLFGQRDSVKIEMHLSHLPDDKKFYLINMELDEQEQIIDSAYSHNGTIYFKSGYSCPFPGAILEDTKENPYQPHLFNLFIDKAPIVINNDYLYFSRIVVQNPLNAINQFSWQLNHDMRAYFESHGSPKNAEDFERYNAIAARYQARYNHSVLLYVLQNPNLFSSLYVFSDMLSICNTDTVRIIYNLLDSQNQVSKFGLKIKTHLDGFKKINIGQPYVNIQGADVKGHTVQLSDFNGQVILLDFWKYACYPCLLQKKYLQELYPNKHDSGLAIVSFSLDTHEKSFLAGIKGEAWVNLVDYKGYFSNAAILYGINSLPTMFLIDRHGVIRAIYSGYSTDPNDGAEKNAMISKLLREK